MTTINGTAQGVGDTITGTRGDDTINGFSGDDVLKGGRGEDRMIGGQGNDVMAGGMDADTFVWSAGHIGDQEIDYVTDFNIKKGDMLEFLDSGSGDLNVLSIEQIKTTETEANGVNLGNNVERGTDLIFTIQNSGTGATQEIVLLDSWSRGLNERWEILLADLGLVWGDNTQPGEEMVVVPTDDNTVIIDGDDIVIPITDTFEFV